MLFPHSLVLDPQPLLDSQSGFLSVYNFLIKELIFMRIVAKCSTCICNSYKVHVEVCNPIPLTI